MNERDEGDFAPPSEPLPPPPTAGAAAELTPTLEEDLPSPVQPAQPSSLERGQPSQPLQETMRAGTPADGGDYETITDAAPEQGLFHIVGGYLDDDGEVHSTVHLRSMDGEDEDLLGNRGVPILDRLNTIVKKCTLRMGNIVDPGKIGLAIDRLPIGARTHLLICLRRTTHWKKTKDIYEMDVRCPYDNCEKKHSYAVNLADLETFDMPNPTTREHRVHLDDAGIDVVWRVASTSQERVLDLVTDKDGTATLTYSIMVRLVSWADQDVRMSMTDLLTPDHRKLRFSPKGNELYRRVKKLSSADRDELREGMLREEPGIDTDLVFDCKSCKKEFDGSLDIAQEAFWFPSVTSRRSKTRSSI